MSSEIVDNRNRAKVCTNWKPESLHALLGECASGVPESKTMAGNSTVYIGTWENRIVPCESFQQAEEARRKYGDAVVGSVHIRGVTGVTPGEPYTRWWMALEGAGIQLTRAEEVRAIL